MNHSGACTGLLPVAEAEGVLRSLLGKVGADIEKFLNLQCPRSAANHSSMLRYARELAKVVGMRRDEPGGHASYLPLPLALLELLEELSLQLNALFNDTLLIICELTLVKLLEQVVSPAQGQVGRPRLRT